MGSHDSDDRPVEEESTDRQNGDLESESGGVTDAAVDEIDGRLVDLLAWILDTETRAKIYVYLLANPGSTSEEVAQGTGLYPSTVREALAELHDEETVTREKRASEGAGNNPYEYTAIKPSELVGGVVDQVQQELNTIFNLDRILEREDDVEEDEPVTITVDGDKDEDADEAAPEGSDEPPARDAESTSSGTTHSPEEMEAGEEDSSGP